MSYTIDILGAAQRQIASLQTETKKRILKKLDELKRNPRPIGAIRLRGEEGYYRVRAGDYRIVYDIHEDVLVVLVIRVAHRREVYRHLS